MKKIPFSLFTKEKKSRNIPKKILSSSVTFSNTEHFRGFKRINVVTHGILEDPITPPMLDGKPIRIDMLQSAKGEKYCQVFLGADQIGCLFGEAAELFQAPGFEAVHLEYEEKFGVNTNYFHPKMLVKLRE